MRRGLAWMAGALGLAALLRALKGRRPTPPDVSPAPDPADELRAAIAEREGTEAAPAEEAGEEPRSLEARRRAVHERAQEAIESMRDADT